MTWGQHGAGRRSARYLSLLVAAVVLLATGAVLLRGNAEEPTIGARSTVARGVTMVARRETRPTLDPARFVGKARLAHQVARDIPDVLDRLYCYCECDKHFGHKSLLSCYTDGHAAT